MALLAGANSARIAQTWLTNMQASAAKYRTGIDGVRDSPLDAAAAKEDEWGKACQMAAQNKRFSKGLAKITFSDWKNLAKNVGGDRIANLPREKMIKVQKAWDKWLPIMQGIQTTVRAMPKDTYAARRQRANAWMDQMHAAKDQ